MICPDCNGRGESIYYIETQRDENSVTVEQRKGICRTCNGSGEKPQTNADRIRAMSDEELAEFLCSLAFARETPWSAPFEEKFCKNCPTVKAIIEGFDKEMELSDCDFVDDECPHGDDVVWWLKQPAEVPKGD